MSRVSRRKFAPERPRRLSGEWRSRGRGEPPVPAHVKAVDEERAGVGGSHLDPDQAGPGRVEQDVARVCRARQGNRRARQRRQMPAGVEGEARVVAPRACGLVAFVGDVDEVAVGRDAHGLDPAGTDRAALSQGEHSVGSDAQHRDLIAARVSGEQIAPVAAKLQRTLRANDRPRALAAGRERRAWRRGQ